MSQLDTWQAQVEEADKAWGVVCNPSPDDDQDVKREARLHWSTLERNIDWETVARAALKIALAAEALNEQIKLAQHYGSDIATSNPAVKALQQVLREIEE